MVIVMRKPFLLLVCSCCPRSRNFLCGHFDLFVLVFCAATLIVEPIGTTGRVCNEQPPSLSLAPRPNGKDAHEHAAHLPTEDAGVLTTLIVLMQLFLLFRQPQLPLQLRHFSICIEFVVVSSICIDGSSATSFGFTLTQRALGGVNGIAFVFFTN